MRYKLLGLLVVLIFGVMLGRLGSGTGEVTVITKYDKVPGPTQTVNVMPETCKRAVDMAVTIRDTAGKFDTVSGPQLDLMSDAGKAIASRDLNDLNDVVEQQLKLRADTDTAAQTLQGDLAIYTKILEDCKKELG